MSEVQRRIIDTLLRDLEKQRAACEDLDRSVKRLSAEIDSLFGRSHVFNECNMSLLEFMDTPPYVNRTDENTLVRLPRKPPRWLRGNLPVARLISK